MERLCTCAHIPSGPSKQDLTGVGYFILKPSRIPCLSHICFAETPLLLFIGSILRRSQLSDCCRSQQRRARCGSARIQCQHSTHASCIAAAFPIYTRAAQPSGSSPVMAVLPLPSPPVSMAAQCPTLLPCLLLDIQSLTISIACLYNIFLDGQNCRAVSILLHFWDKST